MEGLEIQGEVPQSKPDPAVKGSTESRDNLYIISAESLEIHVEALVTVETKSIVEVVGADIGN